MVRFFVSIEIPENVIEKIKEIQRVLPEFEGKFIEPENLHLTLKFLGENSEERLKEVTKKPD